MPIFCLLFDQLRLTKLATFFSLNEIISPLLLSNMKEIRPDKRGEEFVQRSSLYQEFMAEREEILRHKWLESEKAGQDIGFERALLDWIRNHRDEWRNHRRMIEDQQRTTTQEAQSC